TPGCQADTSGCQADTSGCQADTSGCQADTPGCQADTSGCHADTPGCHADTPGGHDGTPGGPADTPGRRADTSGRHAGTSAGLAGVRWLGSAGPVCDRARYRTGWKPVPLLGGGDACATGTPEPERGVYAASPRTCNWMLKRRKRRAPKRVQVFRGSVGAGQRP